MTDVSLHPTRLERRPQATAFQLNDFLDMVRDGHVRIPPFQRKFKWRNRDRIDLLDSIYRGFPIGTLLLWKKEARAQRLAFGNYAVDAPSRHDALWLVDGQQRTIVLAEALLMGLDKSDPVILFDLQEAKFIVAPKKKPKLAPRQQELNPEPARYLPVTEILDSNDLMEWLLKTPLPTDLRKRALEVGKRIREYQIPVYITETDDPDVLREIFDRTNRTGVSLTAEEVFTGLFGNKEGNHPSGLGDVAASLKDLGAGNPSENLVLNILRELGDLRQDMHFVDALKKKPDQVGLLLAQTEIALRNTILFLKKHAEVPHLCLCPYPVQLVVLAKFFHLFPDPAMRTLTLLRRWYWRGVLGGQPSRSINWLRPTIGKLRGEKEGPEIQALVNDLPSTDLPAQDQTNFNFRSARGKTFVCVLASLTPLDVQKSSPINLTKYFSTWTDEDAKASPSKSITQIIPGKYLPPSAIGSFANRILHPSLPHKSIFEAMKTDLGDDILRSHALPINTKTLLEKGRFEDFLNERQLLLSAQINHFLDRNAAFGADDSPALTSLRIDDE